MKERLLSMAAAVGLALVPAVALAQPPSTAPDAEADSPPRVTISPSGDDRVTAEPAPPLPPPAAAAEGSPPRDPSPPVDGAPLSLEAEGEPPVDLDALRQRLADDLGVEVRIAPGAGGEGSGAREGSMSGARLTIAVQPDGAVRIVFRRAGEPARSRATDGVEDREEMTAVIALLAANLIRDEATELLAMLRIERTPRPEETPAPPAEAPAEELDVPPPPAPDPEDDLDPMPFAIDFVPGLGFSTVTQGRDRRSVSLGAIGALSGAVRGYSGSGVVDISRGSVRGVQQAGVLAIAGREVRGLQGAGVLSVATGDIVGAQLSGVANVGGPVEGVQLSGVFNFAGGDLTGVQAALINVTQGDGEGAQLGLINAAGGLVRGGQVGLVNVAKEADGAQVGLTNIAQGRVSGAQIGLVNIAGGPVQGLQLGLINIAESADAGIGLVNIYARSRTQLRFGVDSHAVVQAELVQGSGVLHSIYSLGYTPLVYGSAMVGGAGLGLRADLGGPHLDVDLLARALWGFDQSPDFLPEVRVLYALPLGSTVGVYFGLGYRLQLSWRDNPENLGPILETTFRDASPFVGGSFVATAGLELF